MQNGIRVYFESGEKMNSVSKKVCVLTSCCSGVVGLAANAENKLPFALIVLGMFVVYLIERMFEDWINHGKTEKE